MADWKVQNILMQKKCLRTHLLVFIYTFIGIRLLIDDAKEVNVVLIDTPTDKSPVRGGQRYSAAVSPVS